MHPATGLEGALLGGCFGDRFDLVAHAVARVDERVLRGAPVDLLAKLAHEHVHGPVAVGRPTAPDALQELVARKHAALLASEGVDEPELRGGELRALTVDVGLDVVRI